MTTYTHEQLDDMTFEELFEIFGQSYKDMLNGNDSVTVAGMDFDPAEVLEKLDFVAFREGFFDYVESRVED